MSRTDGSTYRAVRVIAWRLLAVSALFCGLLTSAGLKFAHEATCQPPPPVAWRQSVTFTGLGVYLTLAMPTALLLLWRGKSAYTIVALALACIAMAVPFITFLIPLMASALC
jgi:hypothetical protein